MNFEIFKRYFFWNLDNENLPFGDIISSLFPLIACILFFRSIRKHSIYLVIYTFAIFIFEITNNIYAAFKINNHDVYLFFYLAESYLLAFYFINQVRKLKYQIILAIVLIIITAAIIDNIFWEMNLMNDYAISIQAFLFIGICLINFYLMLKNNKIENLTNSIFFLINCTFLIYFTGKFFVSLFVFELFSLKNNELVVFWDIITIITFACRFFLAIIFFRINTFAKANTAF